MARTLPRKLLKSAQRVKVFNSGLEVWLYDQSFRKQLKATGAFEIDAEDGVLEKALHGLVKTGRIMCYSLMQDDSVNIAIAVREPLATTELGTVPWRKPQEAFLRLPTGRLIIESNDSLTLRKLEPTDPGAEIAVPPGDYLVTLYRVDWDVLAEEGIDWDGPSEFITLTSGNMAKPVTGQPAVLAWEEQQPDAAVWRIQDGTYAGAAIFDDDLLAMRIALGEQGISELGLGDKSVSLLSVPDLGFECALVWIRGDRKQGAYYDRLERLHLPKACLGKEWAICNLEVEVPGDQTIFCLRRDAKVKIARKDRNVWHQASMRVLDNRALEKK